MGERREAAALRELIRNDERRGLRTGDRAVLGTEVHPAVALQRDVAPARYVRHHRLDETAAESKFVKEENIPVILDPNSFSGWTSTP